MPAWFIVFLLIIIILALVALALVWRRKTRRARSRALALDYASTSERQHAHLAATGEAGDESTRLRRLRQGTLVWKYAFHPCAAAHRSLRRIALLRCEAGEAVYISRTDAHRASDAQRPLTESDLRFPLSSVLAVQLGPMSDALKRGVDTDPDKMRLERAFSLITDERTVDLEALSDGDLRDWVIMLQSFLESQQQWAGLPIYDDDALTTAQRGMRRGRMPQSAFAFSQHAGPIAAPSGGVSRTADGEPTSAWVASQYPPQLGSAMSGSPLHRRVQTPAEEHASQHMGQGAAIPPVECVEVDAEGTLQKQNPSSRQGATLTSADVVTAHHPPLHNRIHTNGNLVEEHIRTVSPRRKLSPETVSPTIDIDCANFP